MDRPNPSGTPGSSPHSTKFYDNRSNRVVSPSNVLLLKDLKAERHLPVGEDEEGLGLENASLQWNEVVGAEKQEE